MSNELVVIVQPTQDGRYRFDSQGVWEGQGHAQSVKAEVLPIHATSQYSEPCPCYACRTGWAVPIEGWKV